MLSGGEKVRLALCKILKTRPNVLVLDEPTNHMDIVGKETLESMLKDYKGTLILYHTTDISLIRYVHRLQILIMPKFSFMLVTMISGMNQASLLSVR